MALTAAERKKKYIEKLKATGKYEQFKINKAAGERARQERIKSGLEQLPKAVREKTKRINRDYNRKKAAKHRERKREKMGLSSGVEAHPTSVDIPGTSHSSIEPYKTASALSKAVAKVKRALPSSSDKKKLVVKKLLRSFDTNELKDIITATNTPRKGSKALKPDVIHAIREFYERDDVSRISPNMRDSRKFANPDTGVKEIKQIRYLMYKLSDAHKLFVRHIQKGNDQIQPVALSKFSALRPAHVKLVNSTPLDQCLCLYHTNFIMCCKAIRVSLPRFPVYGPKLELILLCESPTKDCWFRACTKCPNAKNVLAKILKDSGKNEKTPVMLCQWKKNNETNRFQKFAEKGTLNTLICHFIDILPEFLKHSFIKRKQSAQYQKDAEEVSQSDGKVVLVQVDFAESFNCESQDEIQSAHWNQATISLFTACMKCLEDIFPNALSSDNTSHTKFEIACYIFKIISQIPPTTETLKIWSDGPNNQFKNRFTAAMIKIFETTLKVKIFWNFFATAHGKGSVDGIGAVVKNRVKRLVKSRQSIVNCSADFCEAFNSEDSVIKVRDMSESEMKKIREHLKLDNIFAAAPAVPDVFSFHQMQIIDGKVKGFTTSEDGYDFFFK